MASRRSSGRMPLRGRQKISEAGQRPAMPTVVSSSCMAAQGLGLQGVALYRLVTAIKGRST